MVRWLQQHGWQAGGFETEYGDDEAETRARGTGAGGCAHA
jgi:putative mRNA 3-end processing factor